jgi:putative hydrolase of the HAD superfamily
MAGAMAPEGIQDRARGAVPRAVLLDALGTLVELVPPWPALVRELAARGVRVSEDEARAAFRAEMAYYRAHLHEAPDRDGLERLRARCARVLGEALGLAAAPLRDGELLDALLASLRFRPYPEVADVLRALRARGARLVVVSNWDVSLHEVLDRTGLSALVDGAIASAELGAAKPDPAIFVRALELAGGVPAAEALHAGDSVEADVEGARGAGLEAVLVARHGEAAPPGTRAVADLTGLLVPS